MAKFEYTQDQLEDTINKSTSWREVIEILNPDANYRGSQSNLKKKAVKLGLNFSHFLGLAHSKGKILPTRISTEDMMAKEIVKSNDLKLRLIKDNIKEYRCES